MNNVSPHAGLWVGRAMIREVSQAQNGSLAPTPVKDEFSFRFILHVDAAGTVRLLKEVIQLWKEGTRVPDPENPGSFVVDEPGHFVLVTDEDLISSFEGAVLRDGEPVGLRVSTIAYDFPQDFVVMSGSFAPGGTLSTTLVLDSQAPTNPFLHRFHPDHDNLDPRFVEFQEEAYSVIRAMEFEITADDPVGLNNPGYGEDAWGGAFRETLSGLHRNDIAVEGLLLDEPRFGPAVPQSMRGVRSMTPGVAVSRGIPKMRCLFLRTRLAALLAAGFLASASAQAIWPVVGGGAEADGATATATDAAGNVYVIGNFRGTAYFGDKEVHARGSSDVFVARYNPDGEVVWAASAGGLLPDGGFDIAVDASQNAYVIGFFMEGMRFENDEDAFDPSLDPLELGRPTSLGRDWFIAKIGPDGIWDWARQVGANGTSESQTGYAVAFAPEVDDPVNPIPAGVVVAGLGHCVDLVSEDGTQLNVACDNKPIKVYRLDTDGDWVWTLSGGNAGPLWISDLAIDASGQVYVNGSFLGNNSLETQPSATPLTFTSVPAGGTLEFQHRFSFDTWAQCYDGGVLEYSTDGAATWHDIGSGVADNDPNSSADVNRFLQNGYNASFNGLESNPLGVRSAWCYQVGAFQQVRVDLSGFAGMSVRFRWRLGTGFQIGDQGWYVDDVVIKDGAGQTIFEDNMESGGGNFSAIGSPGATPWTIASGTSTSPSRAWYVPDSSGTSDQKLAMNRSVALADAVPSMFVAKIANAESTTPSWAWAAPLPAGSTAGGLATDGTGGVYIGGTTRFASSTFGGISITTAGAFAAKLSDSGSNYSWQWIQGASGGDGKALVLLPGGDVAIAGTYTGSPLFSVVQIDPLNPAAGTAVKSLPSANGTDVFVARSAASGTSWRWATFAGDFEADPVPVTSPGVEVGTALAASPDGAQLYVGGAFDDTATFGTIPVTAVGMSDAFVANLAAADGAWFFVNFQRRTVGAEVLPPLPPEQLCLTNPALAVPTISILGPGLAIPDYFHWTPPGVVDARGHLYAVQPINAEISWKKNAACPFDSDERVVSPGATDWPREADGDLRYCGSNDADAHPGEPCIQLHVAGAPADIEPAPAGISFGLMVPPRGVDMSPDAVVVPGGVGQARFNATSPGFSVLLFADDPGSRNISQDPVVIRAVQTVPYDTPLGIDGVSGLHRRRRLRSRPGDRRAESRGLRRQERLRAQRARLLRRRRIRSRLRPRHAAGTDRSGESRAVRPRTAATRWRWRGTAKDYANITWPVKSVRYDCRWPAAPDKIIIASELGSEVLGQPPLDPAHFPGVRIYQQANDALPGFNPNDEHVVAPARELLVGIQRPLRAAQRFQHLRDRSVHRSPTRFSSTTIRSTAAGGTGSIRCSRPEPDTSRSSTAAWPGAPVNPPYPVRLIGNCDESEVNGKPAFKDYKNQTWAKAAGDLVAEYWYPLQPTFYYDRDGDHTPERTTGECIAWLGGLGDDPVNVAYSIAWPPNVPTLVVGETLLKPKFGLPDIMNQAAVEIVFDEKVERSLEALEYAPTTSLARLVDPLSSRSVFLPSIPSGIGTDTDVVTGRVIPLSNADGTESASFDARQPDQLRPAQQEAVLRRRVRRAADRRSGTAPERPHRRGAAPAEAAGRRRRQRRERLRRDLRHARRGSAPGISRSRRSTASGAIRGASTSTCRPTAVTSRSSTTPTRDSTCRSRSATRRPTAKSTTTCCSDFRTRTATACRSRSRSSDSRRRSPRASPRAPAT